MKDIFKIMGTYFAVGFGTLAGVGAGMKACDILLNTKLKKQKSEKVINVKFEKESKY